MTHHGLPRASGELFVPKCPPASLKLCWLRRCSSVWRCSSCCWGWAAGTQARLLQLLLRWRRTRPLASMLLEGMVRGDVGVERLWLGLAEEWRPHSRVPRVRVGGLQERKGESAKEKWCSHP